MSKVLSRRDLAFLLYEWLDVEKLTARERYADHSRETFDAFLDVSQKIAERDFAPHNRKNDLQEPTFDGEKVEIIPEVAKALKVFAESGLIAGTVDAAHGGLQLPLVVQRACFLWFQAANTGTSAYAMLTSANAHLLLAHGTDEQIATFVEPMLEGRFTGTMCLSEPQAGSSLSDVTTKAVKSPDGDYKVTGSKMWISGGDHELSENIIHLVLARVAGAPAGVKGLSLFIVPKKSLETGERNGVTLAGLNHKMGYRGTTNAVLAFDDATGFLVGEEGRGLQYMFHMMNEARIGVGAGAVALGYTGYLHALDYAKERQQGRPVAGKDPSAPPVAIIEHPDVRRMLLASKSYVEGGLALILYAAKLVDEPSEENGLLLDVLTPIVKAWPSQWCRLADDHAIQIHGGYGYTREYPVEQFYRDNRLNSIHEGTDGIQALDLLGRKVTMKGGAGLKLLLDRIQGTASRVPHDLGKPVAEAVERLARTTAKLWASGDPAAALANATAYLDAAGHLVIAWIWLEQWLAAEGKEGDFYEGKRLAARYFITHELPRIGPMLDLLDSGDTLLLDLDEAWLG
ncbi:alkylation response protein AidB-like acyl-CoA dehydrogenase [Actinoplanes lutulentus]|uniref:Alkylation response protein AidB-like acyl-CoA dehydrogenase n=1 Tax=Actinoplanes lutulentus TaxID=1287878 RepID=A0A327Z7D1_9ACTN|nr:acyl-CoA dehydrogenase [Actinoplanes lutulentus]MBB2942464.1 alkylation response protein AidB-like acyl-CoA dehydrogenase [Actinoplanes lutulentus]RAK33234.1 alkylation response protein AidB-like acyl-CoA dehydrogenase [Actinoplanes lutulentus]